MIDEEIERRLKEEEYRRSMIVGPIDVAIQT